MSYSRWSNSTWYTFYNINGCLSLWYDMEHTIDIPYEEALHVTKEDIIIMYGCTEEQAAEAMEYVGYFIEDYDPKVKEEYELEYAQLMAALDELQRAEEKKNVN
jgi:hypothetical protein